MKRSTEKMVIQGMEIDVETVEYNDEDMAYAYAYSSMENGSENHSGEFSEYAELDDRFQEDF